jgi:predicted phage terminase large subunit-like protein
MMNNSVVVDALSRRDLYWFIVRVFHTINGGYPFLPNWHIEVMSDWLMMAARGELKRLIFTLPPRQLKSISASVALPAWLLGIDPTARIVCISYSDDLAKKHARDCRKIIESNWYKRVFPKTCLSGIRSATGDFETSLDGGRFTTSVGGTLTGRGGGFIIIDDPIKPDSAMSAVQRATVNQWFDNTVYSRLDNKNTGVMILIMQRLHQDDLVAHVKEKEHWEEISLSAIAETDQFFTIRDGRDIGRKRGEALHPNLESLGSIEQTRKNIGSFIFQAQYQQCPVPESGNLIKWEWFQIFEGAPPSQSSRPWAVQSWDTALSLSDSADWSVCTTWVVVGQSYYLIDVYRVRLDFPSLKRKIIELKKQFNARDVLIEDAGAAVGLIQQLRDEQQLRPIALKPEGSKVDRMAAQSAIIEAGNVFIPVSASWLDTFRSELLAFPAGKHDDQVDSVSQFLNWIGRPRGGIHVLHVRA